jgi:hypothetical protein
MSSIEKKLALIVIGVSAIICMIIMAVFIRKSEIDNKTIAELNAKLKQYESIQLPSKGEIDSLKANISNKDSIIKQIKIEYIKDVEIVKNMPDSDAVNLFHQLVWSDTSSN